MMGVFRHMADRIMAAYYLHVLKTAYAENSLASAMEALGTLVTNGCVDYGRVDDALFGKRLSLSELNAAMDGFSRTGATAMPEMLKMLKDKQGDELAWSLIFLEKIAEANPETADSAIHAMIEHLNDADLLTPIMSLGSMVNKVGWHAELLQALPPMIDAMKGGHPISQHWILYAMRSIGDAAPCRFDLVLPSLFEALISADSRMRSEASRILGMHVDRCDTADSVGRFEGILNECAAASRGAQLGRDEMKDAMIKIAKLMVKTAVKKNEFFRSDMGGELLLGERPKPPKDGGMYRKIGGMKRAVRHG